jgi:hypothetical protein
MRRKVIVVLTGVLLCVSPLSGQAPAQTPLEPALTTPALPGVVAAGSAADNAGRQPQNSAFAGPGKKTFDLGGGGAAYRIAMQLEGFKGFKGSTE